MSRSFMKIGPIFWNFDKYFLGFKGEVFFSDLKYLSLCII